MAIVPLVFILLCDGKVATLPYQNTHIHSGHEDVLGDSKVVMTLMRMSPMARICFLSVVAHTKRTDFAFSCDKRQFEDVRRYFPPIKAVIVELFSLGPWLLPTSRQVESYRVFSENSMWCCCFFVC